MTISAQPAPKPERTATPLQTAQTVLFERLAYELDKDVYERLERQNPAIASVLGDLILDGANADHIRVFVRGHCFDYEQRERLTAAARYLEKVVSC